MNARLILASGSPIRRNLLEGAGLSLEVEPANVDERALESELEGQSPEHLAQALAVAKAVHVSKANPNAWIIGADQVLDHDGGVIHKAPSSEAAAKKLQRLQGSVHHLTSAAALVKNGQTLWSGHDRAALTMRPLSTETIEAYLAKAGDAATQSVGAYQLEELGAALFERIDGDYFTILGLPLLPLLAALRDQDIDPIDTGGQP
ncbi:MAG: Maf family nucleotide pyrophosphatase [Pseudomonadota bacterium]